MPLFVIEDQDHIEHWNSGGQVYTTRYGATVHVPVYDPPMFILQHPRGKPCALCGTGDYTGTRQGRNER